MIKVRGYMFSRTFMGERVPQHIQNNIIRNYCIQNGYHYMLSAVEYAMKDSYLILSHVINEKRETKGIGFYSMFQLPENDITRLNLMKKIIKLKKVAFFCNEGFEMKNLKDLDRINTIWLIKKNLNNSLKKFNFYKKQ